MKLLILFFIVHQGLLAEPVHFDMRDALLRNNFLAISEMPLERTIVTTSFVSGYADLNPEDLSQGIKFYMELDSRTLDFGNELKNINYKEKIFKVTEYPNSTAQFELKGLKGKLKDAEPLKIKPTVDVFFGGENRKLLVPIEITFFKESEETKKRLTGNLFRLRANFLFEKNIQILVEMIGSDKLPTALVPLPEGPKKK